MKTFQEVEQILKAAALRKEAPLKQAVWGVKVGKEDNLWEPVGECRCIIGNYLLGQIFDVDQSWHGFSPLVSAAVLLDIEDNDVAALVKGFDAYPQHPDELDYKGEWWQLGYDIAAWADGLGILTSRHFSDLEI
jgi:hypothetical protein